MNHERIARVLDAMREKNIPQLIISDPDSICYLTDVSVGPGERFYALYLGTDGELTFFFNRLFSVPEVPCKAVWLSDTDSVAENVAAVVDAGKTLGVDKLLPARFLIPIMERLPGLTCVLGSECVDWVRAVKDESEREKMRRSSALNDRVMLAAKAAIHEGATEREIAAFLRERYIAEGCDGVSFAPIVSFGANAADPHHMPDDTVIKEGDCIVLDIGGLKDGYCSDMTRTYFYKRADPKYAAIHDLVRGANEYAESIIKPGVRLCDIDAAARDRISDAGYGEYFTHRLGHFIGRRVHEYGDVSAAFDTPVKEGMCFSIEPGVYLPGEFGVRVEDLVIVTKDGCEVLNRVDKHWEIVG